MEFTEMYVTKTLHSLLKLPRKFKDFSLLKNEIAKTFQRQHKNVKFLIIDEMSMIGLRLMGMLEQRCQELFPSINEPFGGLYVYLFGDFRQLPPVRDLPLYSDTSVQFSLFSTSYIQKNFTIAFAYNDHLARV